MPALSNRHSLSSSSGSLHNADQRLLLSLQVHLGFATEPPRVQAPALVVRGTRDQIVSQGWTEEAARLLPNAQLAIIPGAAHAINFSYPAEFKRVLMPFLLEARPLRADPAAQVLVTR